MDETLRKCMEEDILTSFLASRQKEMLEIMVTLFDQEKVREIREFNIQKEAQERGRQEGRQMEREVGIQALVSTLRGLSIDRKIIAQKLVEQYSLLPRAAEEKVKQYWKQ